MHTKTYRFYLTVVAVSVIIACIATVYYMVKNENKSNRSIIKESEFMYYLKEHDEKIGVYKINENLPFMTIDVYVNSLPYVDQVALSEGIEVQDDKKLKILIEDYES